MGEPQLFAFSGMLVDAHDTRTNFDLVNHAISLAGERERPRVCYVPTAIGDAPAAVEDQRNRFAEQRPDVELSVLTLFPQPSVADVRAHLLGQDVLLVEGGSVVNLMALWHVHGLRAVMRECWEAGVVLAGASAGSLCWHVGGPTDSFGDELAAFTDGLGFLPWSNGVHDDFDDQPRREVYRAMVADGLLPGGWATEDGVGLHYVGTELREAVTVRAGSRAWRVDPDGAGGYVEQPVAARLV
jgi:peptidase E